MASTPTTALPLGDPITTPPSIHPSSTHALHGKTVSLVPLDPTTHATELWPTLSDPQNTHLFTYLPYGPFATLQDFRTHLETMSTNSDLVCYAVIPKSPLTGSLPTAALTAPTKTPPSEPQQGARAAAPAPAAGLLSYLNISPQNQSLEIGHILLSPFVSRTTSSTECLYLLLSHAFNSLGYERVVWKCNDLNAVSRNAALRFGFVHEGVFRRHLVVKGRRRDTWWGSMLVDEWEGDGVGRETFEKWLDEGNFDEGGRQRVGLREVREGLERMRKDR